LIELVFPSSVLSQEHAENSDPDLGFNLAYSVEVLDFPLVVLVMLDLSTRSFSFPRSVLEKGHKDTGHVCLDSHLMDDRGTEGSHMVADVSNQ
jgi:hypothetical protein